MQDELKGSGDCGIYSVEHGREYVGGEGLAGRTGRPGHSSIRAECPTFTESVRSAVGNLRCCGCSAPILILCARQDAQGCTEALSRAGGRQRVACCAWTPPLPEQQVAAAAAPLEATALTQRARRYQGIAHARPVIGGESSLRAAGYGRPASGVAVYGSVVSGAIQRATLLRAPLECIAAPTRDAPPQRLFAVIIYTRLRQLSLIAAASRRPFRTRTPW